MRKPNGYGAVIKLSGNRRKPYAVRITTGWSPEGKQQVKYIGYYPNRKEAEIALAEYNKNPYIITEDLTFAELYDKYYDQKLQYLKPSSINTYRSSFNLCEDLHRIPITQIKLGTLQQFVDRPDINYPRARSIKTLWGSMFDYAIRNEYLPPERKQVVALVDLSKKENPNAKEKVPFTKEEIKKMWLEPVDTYGLILCYTGLRISEMLSLKEKDIHIEEQYLDIKESKTKAGVRRVPIADKILPLMKALPINIDYKAFMRTYWNHDNHTPHDARHTFISLLTEKEVDPRVIKAIVGHAGSGVTEAVYTHISLQRLLEAVNLLD